MNQSRHLEKLDHFKAYNPTAAELRKASQREVEEAETLTRRQRVVCFVCCLIAAAIMVETLFFKFTGAAESKYIFQKMGTEPWMRWVQGFWELTASIGLLLPRLRWAGVGIFMVSGSVFTILLHHPASPALQVLREEFPAPVAMGLVMRLTAIGIIY